MKLLKNSTYEEMTKQILDLRNENLKLKNEVMKKELSIEAAKCILKLADNELAELSPKAAKYDKEVARLKLKNQVARVKKMSAKRLAEKFLGTTVMFYDETPAIICGYTNENVVICACNHEEKSWTNKIKIDSDVILQEHERYVYFASRKVALQIINHLKTQK